jgi:hypothetical protein
MNGKSGLNNLMILTSCSLLLLWISGMVFYTWKDTFNDKFLWIYSSIQVLLHCVTVLNSYCNYSTQILIIIKSVTEPIMILLGYKWFSEPVMKWLVFVLYLDLYMKLSLLLLLVLVLFIVFIAWFIHLIICFKRVKNVLSPQNPKLLFTKSNPKLEDCSICLYPLVDDMVKSNICGHEFHFDCIEKWLFIQRNCPLCKQKFLN